jgi:flagellar assembly factor FliW
MTASTDALSPAIPLETRFGRFDVRPDSIIAFPEGLPGFEKCLRFVLLSSEEFAPLWCLQGIDAPEPSFLAVDPLLVMPDYRRELSAADRARVGDEGDLAWLALVTVGDDEKAAVNLRAPIVINAARMAGVQVIQPRNRYQINHPLAVG